jgi:hypothetical protein
MQSQVDRDVQDPGALWKIHAQEENVGPPAVGEIEAHRRPLDQDGEQCLIRRALEEPRLNSQRMLLGAADPKHPPVALAAPDRPPYLVGERLKGDLLVGPR